MPSPRETLVSFQRSAESANTNTDGSSGSREEFGETGDDLGLQALELKHSKLNSSNTITPSRYTIVILGIIIIKQDFPSGIGRGL